METTKVKVPDCLDQIKLELLGSGWLVGDTRVDKNWQTGKQFRVPGWRGIRYKFTFSTPRNSNDIRSFVVEYAWGIGHFNLGPDKLVNKIILVDHDDRTGKDFVKLVYGDISGGFDVKKRIDKALASPPKDAKEAVIASIITDYQYFFESGESIEWFVVNKLKEREREYMDPVDAIVSIAQTISETRTNYNNLRKLLTVEEFQEVFEWVNSY